MMLCPRCGTRLMSFQTWPWEFIMANPSLKATLVQSPSWIVHRLLHCDAKGFRASLHRSLVMLLPKLVPEQINSLRAFRGEDDERQLHRPLQRENSGT